MQQLDEEDRNAIYQIIDRMLVKNKFKGETPTLRCGFGLKGQPSELGFYLFSMVGASRWFWPARPTERISFYSFSMVGDSGWAQRLSQYKTGLFVIK